jgi:hypothetical protein
MTYKIIFWLVFSGTVLWTAYHVANYYVGADTTKGEDVFSKLAENKIKERFCTLGADYTRQVAREIRDSAFVPQAMFDRIIDGIYEAVGRGLPSIAIEIPKSANLNFDGLQRDLTDLGYTVHLSEEEDNILLEIIWGY